MSLVNQIKIRPVEYKNELYGKFIISNNEITDTIQETNNFTKENDIYIDEHKQIYLKENTTYYIV